MSNKRVKYIKDNYTNIPEEHIDLLKSIDVSNNSSYLVWLARMYSQGEFMYKNSLNENAFQSAKSILNSFHKNKSLLPKENRDINKFKSLFELSSCMFFIEKNKNIDEEEFLRKGASKIFESDDFLVVKPLTMEASVKFGKDTRWCTASNSRANNYFHSYASRGETFIIINKKVKNRASNSKFQFHYNYKSHYSSSECRNSLNNSISDIDFFIKNSNVFNAIFEKSETLRHLVDNNYKYFPLVNNPSKKRIIEAIKQDESVIKYISEELMEKTDVQMAYLEHFYKDCTDYVELADHISKSQFNYRFKNKIKKPCKKAKKVAISINPNLIGYIEKNFGKCSEDLRKLAIETDVNSIKHIEDPSDDLIDLVLNEKPRYICKLSNPTEIQQIRAVERCSDIIKKIDKPSRKVLVRALQYGDEKLFKYYIKSLKRKEIEKIISYNNYFIKYVENPNQKMQLIAIKDDYTNINYISNPCEKAIKLSEKIKKENEKLREDYMRDVKGKVSDTSRTIRMLKHFIDKYEYDSKTRYKYYDTKYYDTYHYCDKYYSENTVRDVLENYMDSDDEIENR